MMYNTEFLNNCNILTQKQKSELETLGSSFSLDIFLSDARLVEK